ncbi:MAG TPA: ROK family protein, partial [Phenylobacterium sp.]|nr:ROK family protein [Phenylobacterium sp.]
MIRIGVDFGGTKIEAAALDEGGNFLARRRAANPRVYAQALRTVRELVDAVEREAGADRIEQVGIGAPGSISPSTGVIRNANSTWLNGRALDRDLTAALDRAVRVANDANCLALSEAVDGAGQGKSVVFGLILGTGVGGGLCIDGQLVEGRNGIAGEIGHAPLPWAGAGEHPGP